MGVLGSAGIGTTAVEAMVSMWSSSPKCCSCCRCCLLAAASSLSAATADVTDAVCCCSCCELAVGASAPISSPAAVPWCGSDGVSGRPTALRWCCRCRRLPPPPTPPTPPPPPPLSAYSDPTSKMSIGCCRPLTRTDPSWLYTACMRRWMPVRSSRPLASPPLCPSTHQPTPHTPAHTHAPRTLHTPHTPCCWPAAGWRRRRRCRQRRPGHAP